MNEEARPRPDLVVPNLGLSTWPRKDCSFGIAFTGCGQSSPCVGLSGCSNVFFLCSESMSFRNASWAAGACFYDITPQACNVEDGH